MDWSAQNVLAVGLGSSVYLWSAHNSKVTRLVDVGPEDTITSVAWTVRVSVLCASCMPTHEQSDCLVVLQGTHISVGTNSGNVELWDVTKCAKVRSMGGHTARVGVQAWSSGMLATGGRYTQFPSASFS